MITYKGRPIEEVAAEARETLRQIAEITEDEQPALSPKLVIATDGVTVEIISVEHFILTYQGQPIAIRRTPLSGKAYPKTVYASRGQAIATAMRMNKLFRTKEFGVRPIVAASLGDEIVLRRRPKYVPSGRPRGRPRKS